MTPRISADVDARLKDINGTWCWCLRHEGRLLDEVTNELGLFDGMTVVIFHQDYEEEFEYDAPWATQTIHTGLAFGWHAMRKSRSTDSLTAAFLNQPGVRFTGGNCSTRSATIPTTASLNVIPHGRAPL